MLGQECCATSVGLDYDGGLQIGDSVADIKVMRRPIGSGRGGRPSRSGAGGGILQKLADAVQDAVHPGSVTDAASYPGGGMMPQSGAQVIPFPVISPYRPLTATRVPVTGLIAFPHSGYYFNGEPIMDFNGQNENDNTRPGKENLADSWGFSGLGFTEGPQTGYSLPSSPSKLQTILGAITTALPTTISALKSQPYYNPNTAQTMIYGGPQGSTQPLGPGLGGAGADIGSQAGAAVGGIGDSIANIVNQHPLLILAGGAALLLLFMKPPSRR